MSFWELALSVGGGTIRMSTPLIFAAIGGIFSERSGVINIALEGKMLVGAFTAAAVTYATQSPLLGLLSGGMAGLFLAFIYGICTITFKSNQIVTGTAMNILAAGTIPFISQILFQNTGSTPEIPIENRFIYFPIFLSWAVAILVWAWFRYSPYGLWHRFAGEHPDALQTAGVGVVSTRWSGVLLAGFFAGIGGAVLSICLSSNYTRNMTAGRGFMSLAALIVGGWKPLYGALACLAFGFFEAFGILLQGMQFTPPEVDSPFLMGIMQFFTSPQFVQIIPYILTIVVVAGFVGKSRPPSALGIPYSNK
jgi:ABC-type uncharacterized transport system permease subunit